MSTSHPRRRNVSETCITLVGREISICRHIAGLSLLHMLGLLPRLPRMHSPDHHFTPARIIWRAKQTTADHLKTLISKDASEAGNRLIPSISRFIHHVQSGNVPVAIKPVFFGAALCEIDKGSGIVRPIAIGNTWRRLCTKVLLQPFIQPVGAPL